jgi:hypothetical protein
VIKLPKEKADQIRNLVYAKADAYGYITRGRNENGQFMTDLVDEPTVGGMLSSYMEKSNIRTYIKDAILNGYTKNKKKEILKRNTSTETIQKVYSVTANVIQSVGCVDVCRSDDGTIFVVSSGTVLKWETALRKALELVAREPDLVINSQPPVICLQLVILNLGITDGDKKLIIDALNTIGVNVRFCGV